MDMMYVQTILLVLVRVVLALSFAVSSYNKFRNMKGFAKKDGVPLPLAYVVAVAEICAAISMITGVLTVWAAYGVVLLMLGTMSLHIFKWRSPYWANKGGWEYDLMLLLFAGVVALYGPGLLIISL